MCRLKLRVIVLRFKCIFIKYLNTIFIYASARDFLEISCTCLILLLAYTDCQMIQAYMCSRPVHRWTIILYIIVLSDTDLVRLVRMETSQKCIYWVRMCVFLSPHVPTLNPSPNRCSRNFTIWSPQCSLKLQDIPDTLRGARQVILQTSWQEVAIDSSNSFQREKHLRNTLCTFMLYRMENKYTLYPM